eukprot:TRINITY_DN5240_c0_g1_i4.p1 TRINITY_DN5240_c0_g1~~TRINITY_DN5240_c0_g1_i4.p1  ORF type:complete len:1029 (-),score=401.61 TRINITY_DN5240_c0_g1_i4:512-3598(-)
MTSSERIKLKDEIARLTKRLQAYESHDEILGSAEEKARIKKIFDSFDAGGCHALDAVQFEEFVFALSETLRADQVAERVRQQQQQLRRSGSQQQQQATSSSQISFEAFWAWWQSPEHDWLRSRPDGSDGGGLLLQQHEHMLLKLQLHSRIYLRSVSRLAQHAKLLQHQQLVQHQQQKQQQPVSRSPATSQPSPSSSTALVGDAAGDSRTRLDVSVTVGAVPCTPAAASLSIRFEHDERAAAAERAAVVSSSSDECTALVAVSLALRDDVSDFEVGEMSGSIKLALEVLKQQFGFGSSKLTLGSEGGRRVLRVSVLFADEPAIEHMLGVVQAVHPDSLEANIDFSHAPQQAASAAGELGWHATLRSELSTTALELLREIVNVDDQTADPADDAAAAAAISSSDASGTGGGSESAAGGSSSSLAAFKALLALRQVSVRLQLASAAELWRHVSASRYASWRPLMAKLLRLPLTAAAAHPSAAAAAADDGVPGWPMLKSALASLLVDLLLPPDMDDSGGNGNGGEQQQAQQQAQAQSKPQQLQLPAAVVNNYYAALRLFDGVHSVRLQLGDFALSLLSHRFHVFALLPCKADLLAAKAARQQGSSSGWTAVPAAAVSDATPPAAAAANDSGHADPAAPSGSGGPSDDGGSAAASSSAASTSHPPSPLLAADVPGRTTLSYTGLDDGNGVVSYLKAHSARAPVAFSSGMGNGKEQDFLNPEPVFVWTTNKPHSWLCCDLGDKHRLLPTMYRLRYGSSGSACCPRSWLLQASSTLTSRLDDVTSPDWHTLRTHINDSSLNSSHALAAWPIQLPDSVSTDPACASGFRLFRVVQTGRNSFPADSESGDEWGHALVVCSLELFGELVTLSEQQLAASRVRRPLPPGDHQHTFEYANDSNGVVYALRQRAEALQVAASSVGKGHARHFIERGELYCWTHNEPQAWFLLGLPPHTALSPRHYSFRYASGGNACCPRKWKRQVPCWVAVGRSAVWLWDVCRCVGVVRCGCCLAVCGCIAVRGWSVRGWSGCVVCNAAGG